MECGYSVKTIHRLTLSSAAYRRSSGFNGSAYKKRSRSPSPLEI
ncbi:hypothetical protein [Polystyrenella longa]